MRLTESYTNPLPASLIKQARELAIRENRTVPDIFRDALSCYTASHANTDMTEDEIVKTVKQVRSKLWPAFKTEHSSN